MQITREVAEKRAALERGARLIKACQGAFSALKGEGIPSPVVGGATFGVASPGGWRFFGDPMVALYRDREYSDIFFPNGGGVMLHLPSQNIMGAGSMSAYAAIGGMIHEYGHILLDGPARQIAKEEYEFLRTVYKSYKKESHPTIINRFMNVFADIRLERALSAKDPLFADRLAHTQEWVWDIEREVRAKGGMLFQALLRDLGKGHDSPSKGKVMGEYDDRTKALVHKFINEHKALWDALLGATVEDNENTVMLPAELAIRAAGWLYEQNGEKLPPPPPDHGEEDDEDDEGDEGGDGDGDGNGGDGNENDDERGDDGKGDADGEGEGDEGEKGEGDEGGDGEGEEDKGGKSDKKRKTDNKKDKSDKKGKTEFGPVSSKDIFDAISNEALDPSSAFDKEIKSLGKENRFVSTGLPPKRSSLF